MSFVLERTPDKNTIQKEYKNKNSLRRYDDNKINNKKNIFKNNKIKINSDVNIVANHKIFQLNHVKNNNNDIIKLGYISVCQFCKMIFNSGKNLPLLFKCGHFFCKKCILDNFMDNEEKIICPEDKYVSNSILELKVLHNLIANDTIMELKETLNTSKDIQSVKCHLHPEQIVTHFVEDTNEIICVYCAFNKYRKNPHIIIKEISEKLKEIEFKIEDVHVENNSCIELIQDHLNELSKQWIAEETKITDFYNEILKITNEKKQDLLEKINNNFQESIVKLSQKMNFLKEYDEKITEVKEMIKKNGKFSNILMLSNNLTSVLQEIYIEGDISYNVFSLKIEEPVKLINFIVNYGELKSKNEKLSLTYSKCHERKKKAVDIDRNYERVKETSILNRSSTSFRKKLQSSSSASNLLTNSKNLIEKYFNKDNMNDYNQLDDGKIRRETLRKDNNELININRLSMTNTGQSKIDSLMKSMKNRQYNIMKLKDSN